MNIFNTILQAVGLVKNLTGSETPEVGKHIEKAGKQIRAIGGGVNLLTISSLFGAGYTIDDFITHWEASPLPTAIIAVVLCAVNIVPQLVAYKYRAIGKSQTNK